MTKKNTVKLKNPVEAHGETLTELTFDEPDLGVLDDIHIEVSGEGKMRLNLGDLHKLVANMANIPPTSAKKIKASDWPGITQQAMGFLSEFLPTGDS